MKVKTIINTALRRSPLLVILAFFLTISKPVVQLQACTICVSYPERTIADRLLESSEIIFARELQNSPYVFVSVETIKGAGTTSYIKMFCDSSTRRKLMVIPESAVVLAKKSGEEKWQKVTFADSDFQSFLRTLIKISSGWANNPRSQERVSYFAKHLVSDHPQIQEQAYLEVGRASYSTIKTLAPKVPREQIYNFLQNFRFIEWHNLYILFLGQSNHPEDHAYIRKQIETTAHLKITTNLAAWSTAFIETNPKTGVTEIEKMYFATPSRSKEELGAVMTSMSILGSQASLSDLSLLLIRKNIIDSYGTLLKHYPEMAGKVAKDLAMWQVRAHVDRLSEIKQANKLADPPAVYLLDYYLSMALQYQKMPGSSFNR